MPSDVTPGAERIAGDEAARIGATRKYRTLSRETIDDVVHRELARVPSRSTAAALAAARESLHRVAAFYLGEPDYAAAGPAIERAAGDEEALQRICRRILASHVSTRERLAVMAVFYRELFGLTGRPGVVADLASACNPFSFGWMGLDRSTRYLAYDINEPMVGLVNRYFAAAGIAGGAELRDVLCSPPTERADVALLLKMYHCLEHRRRGAGWEVVAAAPASHVAVSFPSRNMRGRFADIAANYCSEIVAGASAAGWRTEEIAIEGETLIVVHKETA